MLTARVGTGRAQSVLRAGAPRPTRRPPWAAARPRLFFITQAETRPPLFVVMTNEPEHIHFSYPRFFTNQLRKAFGFEGRAASRRLQEEAAPGR